MLLLRGVYTQNIQVDNLIDQWLTQKLFGLVKMSGSNLFRSLKQDIGYVSSTNLNLCTDILFFK